ncbi:hypothetical protein [Streptomyces sp. XD-27]|uniref:hypothetical protein n=1 Tax=Streptomyces sp. XD-27 TaxID=3062779 RepID=UPI0026F434E3|nr:hypothetical protein [Streptomyces sp. XD-27]WKX70318.1 hypothetical protein Q3Y56_10650 [Streptomyces sp. XD-27]
MAGTWTRVGEGKDESDLSEEDKLKQQQIPGIEDPHPVGASYRGSGTASSSQLRFSGSWGNITDPEKAVDVAFQKETESAQQTGARYKIEPQGSPQKFTPTGFDGTVMKCQVFKVISGTESGQLPLCIWGDSSTVAEVTVLAKTPAESRALTLERVAEVAAAVRKDTRVPTS